MGATSAQTTIGQQLQTNIGETNMTTFKGFGPKTNTPSDFDRFCVAMLEGFLNETLGDDIVPRMIAQHGQQRVLEWLPLASNKVTSWAEGDPSKVPDFAMPAFKEAGLKRIREKFGAVPGKDFSPGPNGGILIDQELLAKIKADLPPEDRAEFESLIETFDQDPFELIDRQLEIPFFSNLYRLVSLRVASLDVERAAYYALILLSGLLNKHPHLKDYGLVEKLVGCVTPESKQRRLVKVVRRPSEPDVTNPDQINEWVWTDLLIALGRIDRPSGPDGEMFVNTDDLRAIDKVWATGDGAKMSIAVLADKMEQFAEEQKNK
jgi:hypothetical protein